MDGKQTLARAMLSKTSGKVAVTAASNEGPNPDTKASCWEVVRWATSTGVWGKALEVSVASSQGRPSAAALRLLLVEALLLVSGASTRGCGGGDGASVKQFVNTSRTAPASASTHSEAAAVALPASSLLLLFSDQRRHWKPAAHAAAHMFT